MQGASEADHRLSVASFPALLVLLGSQERWKCSAGRVEDKWLVTRPHASLDLELSTGWRGDDDPRLVLTLDAAGHVKKSRHAVLSGVLSLRFPVAGGGQSSSAHCDTAP